MIVTGLCPSLSLWLGSPGLPSILLTKSIFCQCGGFAPRPDGQKGVAGRPDLIRRDLIVMTGRILRERRGKGGSPATSLAVRSALNVNRPPRPDIHTQAGNQFASYWARPERKQTH